MTTPPPAGSPDFNAYLYDEEWGNLFDQLIGEIDESIDSALKDGDIVTLDAAIVRLDVLNHLLNRTPSMGERSLQRLKIWEGRMVKTLQLNGKIMRDQEARRKREMKPAKRPAYNQDSLSESKIKSSSISFAKISRSGRPA